MALIRTSMVWNGSTGGQGFTQHYFLGAGDLAHCTAAVTQQDGFYDSLASNIANDLSWVISGDVEVIDVGTGLITSVVTVPEALGSGTHSDEKLPLATQGLVRWRTGTFINGRRLQGRTFLPGMVEFNNADTGRVFTGFVGTVNTAAATFIGGSADPAIYSKTHSSASSIQSASMWTEWAVLRSRRD
jgi:hypothetical protein